MQEVNLGLPSSTLELDVCRPCQLLWFDAGELDEMGADLDRRNEGSVPITATSPLPPKSVLSPEAKTAIAMMKIKAIAAKEEGVRPERDPHPLMWFVALFGLPVEMGTHWVDRIPVVTWTIALTLIVANLLSFQDLTATVQAWGFISDEPLRKGGLTFFTSFMLHGNWVHLLSNLYFLIVFGDNIEVQQGPGRLIGLLILATIMGDLLHLMVLPGTTTPLIGASGGIAGVMLAYAMLFPRARLGVLLFFFPLRIPIGIYIGLWLMVQILATLMMSDSSMVGYTAHLGGAVAGLAAGYHWRRRG